MLANLTCVLFHHFDFVGQPLCFAEGVLPGTAEKIVEQRKEFWMSHFLCPTNVGDLSDASEVPPEVLSRQNCRPDDLSYV